jgi:hypothetical protein
MHTLFSEDVLRVVLDRALAHPKCGRDLARVGAVRARHGRVGAAPERRDLGGAWAQGFVAHEGDAAATRPTFRAKRPGMATITATWADGAEEHEQTFTFQVTAGRPPQ